MKHFSGRKTCQALLAVWVLACAGPALAGPYEEAKAAFKKLDYAAAAPLFRMAAEQGNADAQHTLGYLYENGLGVPRDLTESITWYRRSAEQGNNESELILSLRYRHGQGVEKSDAEAAKWYKRAAEHGNVYAQKGLGDAFKKGDNVPQDYAEAIKWYRLAGEQGDGRAFEEIGDLYSAGQGVAADRVAAIKWYQLAIAKGDTYAKDKIQAIQQAQAAEAAAAYTMDLDGAELLLKRRTFDKAISLLTQLLAADPASASGLQGEKRVRAQSDLGYAYNETNQSLMAEVVLTQALQQRPDYFAALVNRAIARGALSRFSGAQKDLDAALGVASAQDRPMVSKMLEQLAQMRNNAAIQEGTTQSVASPGAAPAATPRTSLLEQAVKTQERQNRENCARAASGANISCWNH